VTEIQIVTAFVDCGEYWSVDEVAKCSVAHHKHQRFEIHRHRSTVVLPDGTEIIAASFDPSDPYTRDRVPDYGVYLDPRWAPPWEFDHVDWPDFGVPEDAAAIRAALSSTLDKARAGERVEIGCLGGHGRTGTALACLAVLTGIPAADAVRWVRDNYCSKAVETPDQEAFVRRVP
jgi:hypothetical protein